MPSGSATQFRYTQTPSKVLHLRNMPWECTEEELVELCKPFGRVVNTMCNVGANRNQAFVEFADQNQAISMVSYYASSSEPAQVRGKTVYIQYSNRQEITNNKGTGDSSGNVLLVTFEGVQPNDVTIEVIHLVFSAFGFVHKIATFEKAAGFQALIQYTDAPTALEAKNSLDGRSIPKYLLPEHISACHMRITFSAHKDLNIKFQSHRSRDYTNPYLPVNQTAIEGIVQPTVGPDGKIKEPESNVLLASIENMQYAVTVDVLHTVFSAFGAVQKIAMFEKNGGMQALIQYPEVLNTLSPTLLTLWPWSQEYLNIYSLWASGIANSVSPFAMAHDDRSRDYTLSDPNAQLQAAAQAPVISSPGVAWQNPASAPAAPFYGSTAASTPVGQPPAWNPNMQAPGFASASTAYPNPPLMANSTPYYPAIGSSSGAPPVSFQASQQRPQYGMLPGAPPHAPPAGQPMYFQK
ncbi:Polypyrimidine tract-binding 1 [Zea mays]|uniref:Polypyrimidine tract-binding 1 n=1 Tax=Zea mays TaxID=4577 RepID=A0A3L6F942_MAIZE|nr:Polypyrimidine tract-binding 1 [Zea mays]